MSEFSPKPAPVEEACDLILALQEDQLSAEQSARLEELVLQHREVRDLFVRLMHQRSVVSPIAESVAWADEPLVLDDIRAASAIRGDELQGEPRGSLASRWHWPASRWRVLASVAAAAVAIVVLAWVLTNRRLPSSAITATPPDTRPGAAVVSNQVGMSPALANAIENNSSVSLDHGALELLLESGTSVIVEAPARFTVQANGIVLRSGRLSATVPAPARGFVVTTPESTITDLGTELGVDASVTGSTRVEVFKGRVSALAAGGTTPPVQLSQGNAAIISAGAIQVDPAGAIAQRFLRHIGNVNALDVVDLLAGGDGTGQRRGMAIDILTGRFGDFPPGTVIVGDGLYHRSNLPVVDGCFVPHGVTQVDSASERFDFGPTLNTAFDHIRAGGTFGWKSKPPAFTAVLGGVDYSAAPHGFIFMHASCGLTFDLNAIRRLNPGRKLASLGGVVGNTEPHARGNGTPPRCTAMVLVDGAIRWQRADFSNVDGPQSFNMQLFPGDRFLTFATIERSADKEFDWIIFADPKLDLDPTKNGG